MRRALKLAGVLVREPSTVRLRLTLPASCANPMLEEASPKHRSNMIKNLTKVVVSGVSIKVGSSSAILPSPFRSAACNTAANTSCCRRAVRACHSNRSWVNAIQKVVVPWQQATLAALGLNIHLQTLERRLSGSMRLCPQTFRFAGCVSLLSYA